MQAGFRGWTLVSGAGRARGLTRHPAGWLLAGWAPAPFSTGTRLQTANGSPLFPDKPAKPSAGGNRVPRRPHPHPAKAMALSQQDRCMVRLYMAGCFHYWEQLPDLAREYYSAGASVAQVRGCVRHLVVFAGYGPCLAATLALHKAKLLPEDTPAKVSGPPGNAFELVYTNVTDKVRSNMHAADPALGEWIRQHLYGDIYSSPGLDLRQKQLLACAFLADANMPDQLFGHALAGLRFGNSLEALEEVARMACEMSPRPSSSLAARAIKTIGLSYAKYCKSAASEEAPHCPEVEVEDPAANIRIPDLPPLFNTPPPQAQAQSQQQQQQQGGEMRVGRSEGAEAGEAADGAAAAIPRRLKEWKAGPPASKAGGWGTSSMQRPTHMAVDLIAARMEAQRARSGLFFSWDSPHDQDQEEDGMGMGMGMPQYAHDPEAVAEAAAVAAAAEGSGLGGMGGMGVGMGGSGLIGEGSSTSVDADVAGLHELEGLPAGLPAGTPPRLRGSLSPETGGSEAEEGRG